MQDTLRYMAREAGQDFLRSVILLVEIRPTKITTNSTGRSYHTSTNSERGRPRLLGICRRVPCQSCVNISGPNSTKASSGWGDIFGKFAPRSLSLQTRQKIERFGVFQLKHFNDESRNETSTTINLYLLASQAHTKLRKIGTSLSSREITQNRVMYVVAVTPARISPNTVTRKKVIERMMAGSDRINRLIWAKLVKTINPKRESSQLLDVHGFRHFVLLEDFACSNHPQNWGGGREGGM